MSVARQAFAAAGAIGAVVNPHDDVRDWVDDPSEVLAFARQLVRHEDFDAEQLLGYLEKPWKWSTERNHWVDAGRPE